LPAAPVRLLLTMSPPGPADRVLVIAPHPDDESLCCAGYLQRATAAGAAVGVVWVTAGDGFELDAVIVERTLRPKGRNLQRLALQRLHEAQSAADELRVPAEHRFFLNYPDRGLAALLGPNEARTYRSRYTGLSAVSYPLALDPGAAYTGANLKKDLARVLDTFKPTIVLAAAPEDRHPDHAASGKLVRELLEQRGQLNRLHYWIVHAGVRWPQPHHYKPAAALYPPSSASALAWESFPLTDEERERKRLSILRHRSQVEVTGSFMLSFVRTNEIFAAP